ncbi:hypothetical protein G6514_001031 [Epicoccum nigrum]|nr:hypothetical protein G6514_001031 [Epicoccum nigrum]
MTLLALYVGKTVYWEMTTGVRLRTMAKQHGSLPAKMRQIPFTLGVAFWWGQIKAIKAQRLLPFMAHSFKEVEAHTRRHIVLGTEWFITQDPENVKAALSTNFGDWSIGQERIKEMSSFLGYGIFVNEGAEWKHSREMLRPCFEKKIVANTRLLERHTQRLFALLPQNGQTVDLQPLLHDLAMDIATDLLFGRSTNALCQDDESSHAVKDFCDAFNYASNPFEQFVDHIIAAQASSSEEEQIEDHRYNLISALSESTQDYKRIRSETLNVLLAGRDTVASLLSNILWELPRHPEILTSLRNEIQDVCGADLPTYEQLKSMKYLRAIVNEAQRLYPIVPANSREALVDTFLPRGGGTDGTAPVLVPKGSYVAWHLYSMQRRGDLFGVDADVFRPERWLEPGFRPGWAFVPFSGGPRVCIGQNMALYEAMYVVVRFVQEFDLSRRDQEEWKEKLSITCIGLNGCKVGLTVREKV